MMLRRNFLKLLGLLPISLELKSCGNIEEATKSYPIKLYLNTQSGNDSLDGLSFKTAKRTFNSISQALSNYPHCNVEICVIPISTVDSVSKLLKLTNSKDNKIRIQSQKEFAEILSEPLRMRVI